MKVTIDIVAGNYPYYKPRKQDMQKNIDAIQRYIDGKPRGCDFQYLIDIKHMLLAMKDQLPRTY